MLSASANPEFITRTSKRNVTLPELSQPVPAFDHSRIMPTTSTAIQKAPAVVKDGKIEADNAQGLFYSGSIVEGGIALYEFDFFQGDNFAAYVVVNAPADSSQIVGTYNKFIEGGVVVAEGDTTDITSGSLVISYEIASKSYKFVLSATCTNKETYTMDAAIPATEVVAIDYLMYMLSVEYGIDLGFIIELQDAPFEPTGETIDIVFTNACLLTDNTADEEDPWIEFVGEQGDNFVVLDLITPNKIGTFGKENIDYTYTAFTTDGFTYVYAKEYDTNKVTVSQKGDTTVIDASIMGKDGNVYHIIMKHYIPTPTKTITLNFTDGDVDKDTFAKSGAVHFQAKNDKYSISLILLCDGAGTYNMEDIIGMNSKQYSFLYDEDDFNRLSIVSTKIELAADNSFTAEFINTDACQYNITFTPKKTAIENTSVEAVKAKKVIRDGQLVIIKNNVEYNALGTQL